MRRRTPLAASTWALFVLAAGAAPAINYRPAADAVSARDASVRKARAACAAAIDAADQKLSTDLDALAAKAMDGHNLTLANQITALKGQRHAAAGDAVSATIAQLYGQVVGRRFRYTLSDRTSKTLEFKPDGTIGGDALAFERRWLVACQGGRAAVAIDGDAGLSMLEATAADGFAGRWNNGLQFSLQQLP